MDVSDRSVRLTIEAQPSDPPVGTPSGFLASTTPFEPQLSESPPRPSVAAADPDDNNEASCSARVRPDGDATAAEAGPPERRLTLLALRLAVLEKAASGLGALGFIWATVVLLGGFAITLERVDFWCVTVILLVEGARIFSRSHELEWQHQATWSLSLGVAAAGRSSVRLVARSFRFVFGKGAACGSSSGKAAGGPASCSSQVGRSGCGWGWTWTTTWPSWSWSWSFLSGHIGRLFYWLQLASATACVALSGVRLARQDFGEAVDARTNRRSALDIFYGLALAEALLFLAEKAAWEWEVSHGRLLERVAAECRLAGAPGLLAIRRFFYDAYSRCVEGSIFDGLRMDLVSFAEELIVGGSHDEQRIGVGILVNVAAVDSSTRLGDAALRRVGTSPAVVERLVEMLSWTGPAERGARASAALVVSKLASKKRNALRVAGVPGAIESVSSLLYAADEECNLLGLLIIKKLARDHDNCSKIGNARGLLDKIIDFSAIAVGDVSPPSSPPAAAFVMAPARAKAVQRSLQVIKMLAETTGSTGKQLRREVAEIVFTVSNIRAVLRHAPPAHVGLRRLGAEVLTRLAMDADARERIGSTGGVIALLLDMFLLRPSGGSTSDEAAAAAADAARVEAGEALAMLALESPLNCERILRAGGNISSSATTSTVDSLVDALGDAAIGVEAGRILTNLCAYTGGSSAWFPQLRRATRGAATVLRVVATVDESKLLEVSLGLAAQLVRLMGPHELAHHLVHAGVSEADLVSRLVSVLATYSCPSIKAPRIRRFTVELVIALLRTAAAARERWLIAEVMAAAGMGAELRRVAETTSELECFHVFSGSAGVSRHAVGLAALVDTALELMGTVADAEPHV